VNSDRLRSPDMRRSPDSFYPGGGAVAEAGETGPGEARRRWARTAQACNGAYKGISHKSITTTAGLYGHVVPRPLAVHVTRRTRRSVGPRHLCPECARNTTESLQQSLPAGFSSISDDPLAAAPHTCLGGVGTGSSAYSASRRDRAVRLERDLIQDRSLQRERTKPCEARSAGTSSMRTTPGGSRQTRSPRKRTASASICGAFWTRSCNAASAG
jgi:hypothetical protein